MMKHPVYIRFVFLFTVLFLSACNPLGWKVESYLEVEFDVSIEGQRIVESFVWDASTAYCRPCSWLTSGNSGYSLADVKNEGGVIPLGEGRFLFILTEFGKIERYRSLLKEYQGYDQLRVRSDIKGIKKQDKRLLKSPFTHSLNESEYPLIVSFVDLSQPTSLVRFQKKHEGRYRTYRGAYSREKFTTFFGEESKINSINIKMVDGPKTKGEVHKILLPSFFNTWSETRKQMAWSANHRHRRCLPEDFCSVSIGQFYNKNHDMRP